MPKKIKSLDSFSSASSLRSISSSNSTDSSNSRPVLMFSGPILANQPMDITALRAFEEAYQQHTNSLTIIGLNPKFKHLQHLATCIECVCNPLNHSEAVYALSFISEFQNIPATASSMKRSFYDQRNLFTNQIATLLAQSAQKDIELKLAETEIDRLQESREFEAHRYLQQLKEENSRLRAQLEEKEAALKAAENEIAQINQKRDFATSIIGGILETTGKNGAKRARFKQ